jgi:hypothetical protein
MCRRAGESRPDGSGRAGSIARRARDTWPRPGATESDTVLLAGVCEPVPTDAAFTWAKARKLLDIR